MNKTSKEFLTKLAALMEDYKVEIEVVEIKGGYGDYDVDGIEFAIPYVTDEGFRLDEFVKFTGRYTDSGTIFTRITHDKELASE